MIGLTVRQMRYFDALAQTLHFGRAAKLAGVSQPALSSQIAEMEQRLDCRLFERGGKLGADDRRSAGLAAAHRAHSRRYP